MTALILKKDDILSENSYYTCPSKNTQKYRITEERREA